MAPQGVSQNQGSNPLDQYSFPGVGSSQEPKSSFLNRAKDQFHLSSGRPPSPRAQPCATSGLSNLRQPSGQAYLPQARPILPPPPRMPVMQLAQRPSAPVIVDKVMHSNTASIQKSERADGRLQAEITLDMTRHEFEAIMSDPRPSSTKQLMNQDFNRIVSTHCQGLQLLQSGGEPNQPMKFTFVSPSFQSNLAPIQVAQPRSQFAAQPQTVPPSRQPIAPVRPHYTAQPQQQPKFRPIHPPLATSTATFLTSTAPQSRLCGGVTINSLPAASGQSENKLSFNMSQDHFFQRLSELGPRGDSFRVELRTLFKEHGFDNMRFIAKPITRANANSPMEIKLRKFPRVAGPASPRDFQAQFLKAPGIAVFKNLGKDATLVCPNSRTTSSSNSHDYRSIGTFAKSTQVSNQEWNSLWQEVGRSVQNRTGDIHLNTEGSGVPWLHIRLDSTPKYVDSTF